MRKLLMFIVLILLLGFAYAKAPIFIPHSKMEVSPALNGKLQELAAQNIQRLPNAKAWKRLLKKYPDPLMAYLIAYEQSSVLAEANPADVMENYLATIEVIKHQRPDYSASFFLSYVAQQTVSDERIESYRKAFLNDGLRSIMHLNPDPLDLYRAVSLWSLERLFFMQTSGRDQSPLDITQKTLVGRCEEMQILFVAACRAVGLPSRPASTPYWAHSDNNHAWAEVFLNGSWIYTGDMDGAWFPNQTWFSGMIDKTVLILTEGAIPDESEEVLAEGRYTSVVNSTVNYAAERSRKLNFVFADSMGNAIANANVQVMVYNWSSLRSIMGMVSDAEGKLSFTAGKGDFYLLAQKDSLHALVPIMSYPSPTDPIIITMSGKPFSSSVILKYPANEMKWQDPPQSYKDDVNNTKAIWKKRVDSFATDHSTSQTDSLYLKVWHQSRNNKAALEGFARLAAKDKLFISEFYEYLAAMDPKFLWQADANQIYALYTFFRSVYPKAKNLGEREKHSLLSPTIFYEELPQPWFYNKKAHLYPRFFRVKANSESAVVARSIAMLKRRYKQDNAKALVGLLRLDISARAKHLNAYQFKILACSALRANGIPAEYTRIPNTISVFVDGTWRYYDLAKNDFRAGEQKQQSETRPVMLSVYAEGADKSRQPLRIDDSNLYLCFYQDGAFYPLNTQFKHDEDGVYNAELPFGNYYLQAGYRISDSETFYEIYPITVSASMRSHGYSLYTISYPTSWKDADGALKELLSSLGDPKSEYLVLGSYHRENTVRIADALEQRGKSYIIIGDEDTPGTTRPHHYSPIWQELSRIPDYAGQTISLKRNTEGKWQMYSGLWYQLPE